MLDIDSTLLKGKGGRGATLGQPGGGDNAGNGAGGGAGYGGGGGRAGTCSPKGAISDIDGPVGYGGDVTIDVAAPVAIVGTTLDLDATEPVFGGKAKS